MASKLAQTVKFVPVLNFLYDILIAGGVSPNETKDLLNMTGLLAALLLGCAISFPTAVSHDELEAANIRLSKCWYKGYPPTEASERLLSYIMWSTIPLAGSTILTIQLYVSMVASVGDKEDEKKWKIWFNSVRPLILIALVFLTAGIVLFFSAIFVLMVIKFPNGDADAVGCEDYASTLLGPTFHIWVLSTILVPVLPVVWLSWTHYKLLSYDEQPEVQTVSHEPGEAAPSKSNPDQQ